MSVCICVSPSVPLCESIALTNTLHLLPSLLLLYYSTTLLPLLPQAVPRMERFISSVCEYLFERDRKIQELGGAGFNGRARPSMEDVLPVLQVRTYIYIHTYIYT